MNKQILTLATALLLAATTVAQTTPTAIGAKLPPDFKQQSTGIAFTENKGQVHDQNYKPRPDVLYGIMTGNMAVHIKNNGVSYQLYRFDSRKSVSSVSSLSGVDGEEAKFGANENIPSAGSGHEPLTSPRQAEPLQVYRIDLTWLNHNPNFTQTQDETLPGCSNYYLENCPNGALHVKSYTGVTLHNLYKGINLHYYEKNNELKHDYIVAAHTDYKQIQIQIKGADISINKDGSLILTTPLGKVQEGAPLVYQNGKQLKAKWIITNTEQLALSPSKGSDQPALEPIAIGLSKGSISSHTEQPALSSSKGSVSFDIENYNPNYELIIDPVTRIWGTYYGETGDDLGYSCTTDASGNVYMAGITTSTASTIIATIGSHQSVFGGPYDAFLVKFNASGVRQWATYYGGAGDDRAYSCATDASGNVYL
ncbi:MAG: hypothetical protein H0X29_11290, partial [Parachlamydiaceae bacterium]|nr:hypothetical protein [Parachlamydiaceae bacterium]